MCPNVQSIFSRAAQNESKAEQPRHRGKAMNASAGRVSAERAHELYDLGLAYIRAAIRANLAEVDSEIAAAAILHPAWPRSDGPLGHRAQGSR